ncbi:MAG: signal peptidase I [Bacteroidetes bacterium]|nr:signal peptidase I [Bacteroidota bacterium]
MINKLKAFFNNKWVKFSIASILYILLFVVWSKIYWSIIGVAFIYDLYISKLYYKYFWSKHLNLKAKNRAYKSAMGWIEAIVFAVVVASIFRIYFVEMYVIPSASMEKSLLVGDYIGVSKMTYGPRLPNTPISIPFVHNVNPLNPEKKSYVEWIKCPYNRLAGFQGIEHHDVVVFNYPEGDTVAVVSPQDNYYSLKRAYGKKHIEKVSKIIYHPVDKRDNYIKRAIALSGDTLKIVDGVVYINGKKDKNIENLQHLYFIRHKDPVMPVKLRKLLGLKNGDIYSSRGFSTYTHMSDNSAILAEKQPSIYETIIQTRPKGVCNIDVFPHDTINYKWNEDNFGELIIPKKGTTVKLNMQNIAIYKRLIKNYENNELTINKENIIINGEKSDSYTFKMNYFFMMGDNRHNSLDSRFFGFVPEDHIVGKASFIWFSKGEEDGIRFGRIFKSIK